MKITLSLVAVGLVFTGTVFGHGPAHAGRHGGAVEEVEAGEIGFEEVAVEEGGKRSWGGSFASGWQSRHVHYGVNETGDGGAFVNELGVWVGDFSLGVWSGFGTGSEFQEWDFTLAYNFDLGPVFVVPGYNLRYLPTAAEDSHGGEHEEDDHGGESHADEEHGEEGHAEHAHKTIGHEVFVLAGLDVVPYVTPSALFVWDLNNTPGAFLELRLDGEVPVAGDALVLQPYALLGVNLGYNTRSAYGWNNFQYGLEAVWQVNEIISVFGGVNQSIAMDALRDIGQGNEVWVSGGVEFRW